MAVVEKRCAEEQAKHRHVVVRASTAEALGVELIPSGPNRDTRRKTSFDKPAGMLVIKKDEDESWQERVDDAGVASYVCLQDESRVQAEPPEGQLMICSPVQ